MKINVYQDFSSDFVPTDKQQEYLIDNPIRYIREFATGIETRSAIVTAPTGTGKTVTAINAFLPEYIRQFKRPSKPLVISYTTFIKTVVDQAYDEAVTVLDGKKIDGHLIRVYNADEISYLRKTERGLDGDVIIVITTNQYFHRLEVETMEHGFFDLMMFDEAHGWVGTSGPEDTPVDRGAFLKAFDPKFFKKLQTHFSYCPWLLISATPTKSQLGFTQYGLDNYVILPPLVLEKMEQPSVNFTVLPTYIDAVELGLQATKDKVKRIEMYQSAITEATWDILGGVFYKANIASLLKFARSGSTNGITWEDCVDTYTEFQSKYSVVFKSISDEKSFGDKPLKKMHDGVKLANKFQNVPVTVNVIDSGDTGMDIARLRNVIMGRNPTGIDSSNNINNCRQLVGRGMRMMFGRDHGKMIEFMRSLPISDEQKFLVASYYIEMNSSEIFACERHPAIMEVRKQVESTTYRHDEFRQLIMASLFDDPEQMYDNYDLFVSSSTSIINTGYKQFRKDHCEYCEVADGETICYTDAKNALADEGKELTAEIWQKVLHVHHKNGNHFDNDPSNLVTICPNIHMAITVLEEDYLNRYPELRMELAN